MIRTVPLPTPGLTTPQLITLAPVAATRVPPEQFPFFAAGVELVMVIPAGRLSVILKLFRAVSTGATTLICRRSFMPDAIVVF